MKVTFRSGRVGAALTATVTGVLLAGVAVAGTPPSLSAGASAGTGTPAAADHAALAAAYQNYVRAIHTAHQDVAQSKLATGAQATAFVDGIVNYSLAQALSLSPAQPLMELLPKPDERLGFNNPDNLYYTSRISDQDSYTITGTRGTSTGFLVEALSGLAGNGPTAGQVTSSVADNDLTYGPHGSFTITLSATRPASGNWLPLQPGTDNLLIRYTFLDWAHEHRGSISIAETGGAHAHQLAVTPAVAASMVDDAARSIALQTSFYVNEGKELALLGPNHLIGPRQAAGQQGTDVQQWNVTGNYALQPDQALIITVKDAPASVAAYSSIVLATPLLASDEFLDHEASLNHDQVHVDSDGSISYVVSAKDPGVANWLDDEGQSRGTIFARWQGVTGALGPEYAPTVTVVPLGDVKASLPADTPAVTPAQQAAVQKQRTAELVARYNGSDPAQREVVRRLRAVEKALGRTLPEQTLPSEKF